MPSHLTVNLIKITLCVALDTGYHSGVAEDQVLWDVALCPTPWVNSTGTYWTVDPEDDSTTVPSNVGRLQFKCDGTP